MNIDKHQSCSPTIVIENKISTVHSENIKSSEEIYVGSIKKWSKDIGYSYMSEEDIEISEKSSVNSAKSAEAQYSV